MKAVLHGIVLAASVLAAAIATAIAVGSAVIVVSGLPAETGSVPLVYRLFAAGFAILSLVSAGYAVGSAWRPSQLRAVPTLGCLAAVAASSAMWATTVLGLSAS